MRVRTALLLATFALLALPAGAYAQVGPGPQKRQAISPKSGFGKPGKQSGRIQNRGKAPSKAEKAARGARSVRELEGIRDREVRRLDQVGVKTILQLKQASHKKLAPAVGKKRARALKREATAYIGRPAEGSWARKGKKKSNNRRNNNNNSGRRPNLRR